MTQAPPPETTINARLIYWGAQGAGKSTALQYIYTKLRPDNRGDLSEIASPVDPNATYEVLPIELGKVGGILTRIQIIAVPGAPEFSATRNQLLDHIDGIVFVVDSQQSQQNANLASFMELRKALSVKGISLDEIPFLIQHNKRDLADYVALEELHRRLALPKVTIFDSVANQGKGVLEVLTTASKQVIRHLRDHGQRGGQDRSVAAPLPVAAAPAPVAVPVAAPVATPVPAPVSAPIPAPAAPVAPPAPVAVSVAAPVAAPTPVAAAPVRVEALPQNQVLDLKEDMAVAVMEETGTPLTPELASAQVEQAVVASSNLCILSVGNPKLADEESVQLPLVLRDATGRQFSLTLTLQLGPLIEETVR